jgi:hypothetical protein
MWVDVSFVSSVAFKEGRKENNILRLLLLLVFFSCSSSVNLAIVVRVVIFLFCFFLSLLFQLMDFFSSLAAAVVNFK